VSRRLSVLVAAIPSVLLGLNQTGVFRLTANATATLSKSFTRAFQATAHATVSLLQSFSIFIPDGVRDVIVATRNAVATVAERITEVIMRRRGGADVILRETDVDPQSRQTEADR
jgi:uncharacterized membrane protein